MRRLRRDYHTGFGSQADGLREAHDPAVLPLVERVRHSFQFAEGIARQMKNVEERQMIEEKRCRKMIDRKIGGEASNSVTDVLGWNENSVTPFCNRFFF